MTQRVSGSQANALIRQAALMNFAQAPISYDNAGIAHQKLFIMQPSLQGGVLLNKSTFQSTTLPASARQEPAQGASGQAAPAQAAPEVKSTPQPVIPTRPQTSYKLSVPVKK